MAVALIGAVLLGEQPLEGVTVFVGAVLLGVAVAEAVFTVGRTSDGYIALAAALFTQAGMVLALHIETGHDLRAAAPEALVAVPIAAAIAAVWLRTAGRRGANTPPST